MEQTGTKPERRLHGAVADRSTWWKAGQGKLPGSGRPKGSKHLLEFWLRRSFTRRMHLLPDGREVPSGVALLELAFQRALEGDAQFAKILFDKGYPRDVSRGDITINNNMQPAKEANGFVDRIAVAEPLASRLNGNGNGHAAD